MACCSRAYLGVCGLLQDQILQFQTLDLSVGIVSTRGNLTGCVVGESGQTLKL